MVSIVIVSHSAQLAQGVRELAEQMTQGRVRMAVAGGIDDPEHPIGTDPIRVMAAIEEVFDDDGVLVLMDLGSALMSAETALDLLDPGMASKVRLCAAPLVEGTMAAAVQASIGAGMDAVVAEAESALAAKAVQLGLPLATTGGESALAADGSAVLEASAAGGSAGVGATAPNAGGVGGVAPAETFALVIPNRLGLHARPASRIVGALAGYTAEVWLERGRDRVNARSVNQISMLSVRQGDTVTFGATGTDARAVLDALAQLAAANFGDVDPPGAQAAGAKPDGAPGLELAAGKVQGDARGGIGASGGPAVGPVVWHRASLPEVEAHEVQDTALELRRLDVALATARRELAVLERRTASVAGSGEAEIFAMHRLLLDDPDIMDGVRHVLAEARCNMEAAWHKVITVTADGYRRLELPYMRERAADIIDVGARVLRLLTGEPMQGPQFAVPSVLLALDLGPSDMAHLDPALVLGIMTAHGGATSHAAILARSMGIPAVVGVGEALVGVPEGATVGLDGDTGQVWLDPAAQDIARLQAQRAAWASAREASLAEAMTEARTADGHRVHVLANIGRPADAAVASSHGAEGVGLFRTEFLFIDRAHAPTEDEQVAAYTEAAAALGGKPVIIRTLDIGGDKPVPYLHAHGAVEENPFLGLRGIRFCLAYPALFMTQLRALLRAAAVHPIRVMFPMVAHPGELHKAREMLAQAAQQLADEGIAHASSVETGIMIEVPAAVALADQLAQQAAFFSIGTNDLAQYVMAADRGNPAVADLSDALHPAVLRMVRDTVRAAHGAGIPVGMCGELAGKVEAIPVLVGLGLDDLSMNAPAIPQAKACIATLRLDQCRALAEQVLAQYDSASVRRLLAGN